MQRKKIRDPKVDPIAGDVVVKSAGAKTLRRTVEHVGRDGQVSYRHRGLVFFATIDSWRRWCNVECRVLVWGASTPTGPSAA